jgi:hypothetical protein
MFAKKWPAESLMGKVRAERMKAPPTHTLGVLMMGRRDMGAIENGKWKWL